uniref:Uncharacterized protein n=1 Tax=Tanacetum cinerariifolium TaxID=118510 RepID=A0A6L2N147_TANCI|nr:hypothetical protein [Tanacetum cinerariifolium]GEU79739.1 hypothetical protein [Tanacetum cinerariifolium]
MNLQDQGVIDSGCSRHMTGNMSYLTDYKEIDGGYVAFEGNPKGGKIIGKCTIKTVFVKTLMKKMYCLVVTDDYSRFTWVFFLATKDETSGILKLFITGIENLVDQKAEAVNTTCYVQNRVIVVKPHNKTPCELFHGRTPTLSLGRPVIILNTIDHLEKFNGKADEGFFVGYFLNSKAFRVFNSRTRTVEENFHTRFTESTPNVVGSRPDWLCDIDALTRTMNYEPIVVGTQSNGFADPKSSHDDRSKPSSDDGKKVDEDLRKENEYNELLFDPNMPALEDVIVFNFSSDDEDDDKVVYKDLNDRLVRAATTASSLEAEPDSGGGPRCQETMRDTTAQTRAFRRVNTYGDFRTKLVEGKENRAGEELEQEITKKKKVEDDKEKAGLKQLMETILDEEEVANNDISLAVKSPRIVDCKIHKEGKKSYYQIVRADGSLRYT